MDIHGLQKLTLLDFPGHVACTVFLAGCDFRCPFCHNGGLVLGGMEPVMDDAGLLDFFEEAAGTAGRRGRHRRRAAAAA